MKLVATRAAGDALTQYTLTIAVTAMIALAFSSVMLEGLNAAVFLGFLTAMGMMLAPMKRIVNINAALQRGIAAGITLFEDAGSARRAGYRHASPGAGEGGGRVFAMPALRTIRPRAGYFNHVSFRVPVGSTAAIVGRSGSGKSTLVGLLPRFHDVDAGSVCLDGLDIREYRLRDLRRQLSLVSQDVLLFDDTIANNIAFGALADAPRSAVEGRPRRRPTSRSSRPSCRTASTRR